MLEARVGANEQLTDHGTAGGGRLTGVLDAYGHLPPTEQPLALLSNGPLQQLCQACPSFVLGGQKAHQHAVLPGRRQLEVHNAPQQLVGHLHEDPRPVARVLIGTRGTAVLEVLERRDRAREDLVSRLVV